MNNARRISAVAATTLGAAALVAATSAGAVFAKAPAARSKLVSVTFFGSNDSSNVGNLNDNWFTKYVRNRFHLKITWDLTGDITTKQPVVMESGSPPPVIWNGTLTNTQVLQYANEGLLIPLNKYIKKYAPNLWHDIMTQPGYKADAVTPSGNIYSLPAYNWCYHCDWAAKMWINGYWLKKLHLSIPTTTAEFTHVLEAFKKAGIVPMAPATETGSGAGWHSAGLSYLMDPFIYYDGSGSYPYFDMSANGKKVIFAPSQPQWRQGLEWIHSLYAKGLISPDFASQTEQHVASLVEKNDVGMVPEGALELDSKDWKYWEQIVPPLKGPHGVQFSSFYGNGPEGATFAITKTATPAQIKAVMKFLNFYDTTLGAEMMNFGPKGNYWKPAAKGQIDYLGQPALFNSNKGWTRFYSSTNIENIGWEQFGPYDQTYAWRNGQVAVSPFGFDGYQEILQYFTEAVMAGHQPKYVFPGALWIPPKDAENYALIQTNITNYIQQWTDEFITGQKSLTKDWSTYVRGLNGLQLSEFVGLAQKYYHHAFNTDQKDFRPSPEDVKKLLSLPVPKADVAYRFLEPSK